MSPQEVIALLQLVARQQATISALENEVGRLNELLVSASEPPEDATAPPPPGEKHP